MPDIYYKYYANFDSLRPGRAKIINPLTCLTCLIIPTFTNIIGFIIIVCISESVIEWHVVAICCNVEINHVNGTLQNDYFDICGIQIKGLTL